VAAIIGLGHSLGLDTIAEGIETEEQADMLIWLGCEQGQGWRYGRPAGADQLAGMIAAEPIVALSSLTSPGDDWATSSLEALPTLRLAQLQAIYDGAPVGLCFLDNRLRYVSLNERLAEMNGSPVKAHIGRSVEEMYPTWFPVFEPFLRRALNGEAISGVDLHRPGLTDGDAERQLLASYQPAWDEADEVIGISISLLDVTAHRLSDYEAYREPGLHEFIFEVNPEVPWVMDSEGNNLQVSSRWVRTTPLGKDRTRNLRWLEALHSEDLENTIRTMKHALQTGKPIDVEYRVLGPEGTWRWMRSTGSPRFGPSGAITRWYGSVEDIHDRKMQEQRNLSQTENHNREDHEALSKGMVLAEALQDSVSDSGRSSRARHQ
jgi:PAS domain S-box-containing protein